MKTNRYEIAFFLVLCALSLFVLTCTPPPPPACTAGNSTRTQGCDEFKRWQTRVFKNSSEFALANWHPLNTGDALSTDTSGEAELNLSACWAGRIYIFKDSAANFQVQQCRAAEFPTSSNCIPFGNWYVGKCAGEFVVYTGSARIVKTGTSFSATFLPDLRQTTLVVVLEGQVSVEPVETFDPTELGPATDVSEGQFYFTMPNAELSDIAGLEPRRTHPIEDLPVVVNALGIQDWMFGVRDRAEEDGVLPGNWPAELGGQAQPPEAPAAAEGLVVTPGGGPLDDPRVQEAVIRGVDWLAARGDGEDVTAFLANQPVDAINDLAYDPELGLALLREAGYPEGLPVVVLYPAEDARLAEAAKLAADNLRELRIQADIQPVPTGDLEAQRVLLIEAGEAVLALTR